MSINGGMRMEKEADVTLLCCIALVSLWQVRATWHV